MGTFTGQISHELAARYGREAVAITDAGHYRAASGKRIEIAQKVTDAVARTNILPAWLLH